MFFCYDEFTNEEIILDTEEEVAEWICSNSHDKTVRDAVGNVVCCTLGTYVTNIDSFNYPHIFPKILDIQAIEFSL